MALLQNMRVLNAEPLKMSAGGTAGSVAATACVDRFCFFNRPETYMNKYIGFGQMDNKGGVPYGYLPPYQFEMPMKEGGMSTFSGITGFGHISSMTSINNGINLLSTIPGYGTIPDIATALSPFIAKIDSLHSGSGTIQDLNINIISVFLSNILASGSISSAQSILNAKLESILSGSGSITLSNLILLNIVICEAIISGYGDISQSNLNLPIDISSTINNFGNISYSDIDTIATMVSNISNSGTITQSQINTFSYFITNIICNGSLSAIGKASCEMSCDITSEGDLVTAKSCAQAVWSALSSIFNEPNTMGDKINSLSTASDPWTISISNDYPSGSAGDIIEKIRKIVNDNQALILMK